MLQTLLVLVVLTLLAGCAATASGVVSAGSDRPGFWLGLWNGLIAPVTFVISLFSDRVAVYAVPNRGHLYDLGFVLGMLLLPSPVTSSRRRQNRTGSG